MNSVIVGEFKVDAAGVGNSDGVNKGDRKGVKSRLGLREIFSNKNSEDDASGSWKLAMTSARSVLGDGTGLRLVLRVDGAMLA